jgi:DNA-binding NarL/FixJ family response regulator
MFGHIHWSFRQCLASVRAGSPLVGSAMDVTDDYTAQNLSARQRDVMKLIAQGLSNKEIASTPNLAE